MSSCSKGSRGSFRLAAGTRIFTANSISRASAGDSAAIIMPFVQVGTYPTRNFCYLRTVIVTAAVYWGLRSRASLTLTPSINLPAPGRHHLYVHFRVCRVLCFNKQLQRPGFCGCQQLRRSKSHHVSSVPSPEVTVPFCLVPSAEFSQALWSTRPDHLCRFRVRFLCN